MDVRNTYCRRIERNRNIALCLDLAKALISARARAALLSLETTSKSPSDSKLLLSNIEKMLRKAMQTCIIGYFENFRFDLLLDTSGQNNSQVKVLKCLDQCFARLRSKKSVSSKTAVNPASRFCEFETLFPTSQSCKTLI